ncbi:MAG: hypothetical protein HN712_17855 [Gemmatimonadetes bacterium]|nr:hypothetical protein [Gemmatimonadota bacterium]MBT6149579.1 hypothetical protein [Gemmatimonadota bacterium]MBT7862187.1 hypothetical protein [Gemmatimonadota bacterium]
MWTAHRKRIIGLRTIYTMLMLAAPLNAASRIALVVEDGSTVLPGLSASLVSTLSEATDSEVVVSDALGSASLERRSQMSLHVRTVANAYRISARMVDTGDGRDGGRILAQEQATGGKAQVFDLVDELASRLRGQLAAKGSFRRSVAVLDFDNKADAGSEPFVSGIQQMLMTSLRQEGQITLIEPSEINAHTTSGTTVGEQVLEVGRWVGADVTISGAFADIVRVEAEVVAATGRHLGTYAAEASRPEADRLVQELVNQLAPVIRQHRRDLHTVALLRFENHSEEQYNSFVDGMADMLTTGLRKSTRLRVIERAQIETAMRNFNVEMSGPIDSETAVEVGSWLGADAVVIGSFLRFGDVFRIDARMIDSETGEVTVAESVRGTEEEVMALVDELGGKLVAQFESSTPEQSTGTGSLRVVFQSTRSEMGERPAYHHICKLYVDGKFIGLSPPVKKLGQWETLFTRSLRGGPHKVEIVHGYLRGKDWDGQMPTQPRSFDIEIEPDGVTTVQYGFEVGWFEDKYIYD